MHPQVQGQLHSHWHKFYFLCCLKGSEAPLQLQLSAASGALLKGCSQRFARDQCTSHVPLVLSVISWKQKARIANVAWLWKKVWSYTGMKVREQRDRFPGDFLQNCYHSSLQTVECWCRKKLLSLFKTRLRKWDKFMEYSWHYFGFFFYKAWNLAFKLLETLRHKMSSLRLLVLQGYIITLGLPKFWGFFVDLCHFHSHTSGKRPLCTGLVENLIS